MRIIKISEDKKRYLSLLLLADEQEDMIDRYPAARGDVRVGRWWRESRMRCNG